MNGAPKPVQTDLLNICDGSIPEVFKRELREVLDNIADVNTPAELSREIVLRVKIKPSKSRESAALTFDCKSKLAPVQAVDSILYLSRDDQKKLQAYSRDVRQEELFQSEANAGNVTPLRPAAAGD